MVTPNKKYLMQDPKDAAKWEALEVLANDPTNFWRTEVDTAGAEKRQREGGFEIVPSQRFNEELGRVSEAVRQKRAGPPPEPTFSIPDNAAESVALLNRQAGRDGVGPAMMAERFDEEDMLAGRPVRGGGLRKPDLGDTERQVAEFQQGLRLKGEPSRASVVGRPSIAVGKPGAGERPRALESLAGLAPRGETAEPSQTSDAAPALVSAPRGDEEFAAAQDEGRGRALAVALSRAGARASEALSGVRGDGEAYGALARESGNPVRDLLARREADKRKALEDPTSEQSRRLQAYVSKALPGVYTQEEVAGITAADADTVTRYGEMRQRLDQRAADKAAQAEQRKADIAREDALRADDRKWQAGQVAAGRAFTAQENAKNRAADLAEVQTRASKTAEAGQKLPAGEAAALGEAAAAVQSLTDLGAAYDKDIASGFGSALTGLTQYLPGTDAALYEDKMRATAQSVGTFLEGGKLAAGDEVKYLRMLPTPGDGAERKKGKIENLNRLIALKRQEKINALKAAGFNMGALGAEAAPPTVGKTVVDRIKMPDGKTVTLYSDGSEEVS